jgi:elongator complex protein 3
MLNSQSKSILELIKTKINSREDLSRVKRILAKKYGAVMITNAEILKEYKKLIGDKKLISNQRIKEDKNLESILRKRSVRTMSGVAPVAVLTKPFACPAHCAYCPTEKNVPKSYLSNEPAVMRAIRCGYDPYLQVASRLRALENNGHQPNKIELIVIGGTWSVLPQEYKYWYIKECFRAANEFNGQWSMVNGKSKNKNKFSDKLKFDDLKKELLSEQKKNEKAKYRIIGITLETRPDYIDEKELMEMRELGGTRVELGVQAIDDKILVKNNRGHGVKEIVDATKLLKNFGFKITYHIMPGLPGSSAHRDYQMFQKLFIDERFQPDQIKFYPTVVTRGSLLYQWWKKGLYKSYSNKILEGLIIKCKKIIPPYVRVIRLIRDIPAESIVAGNIITNLRQIIKARGVECKCIRCREAGEKSKVIKSIKSKVIKYKASGGEEYFISFESKDEKTLFGFCRLRINGDDAMIRELHVYGELVPVGGAKKIQHMGLGKKLMLEAEKIAKKNKCKKISVIAGVGVREYYKKLGYELENTYMVKICS